MMTAYALIALALFLFLAQAIPAAWVRHKRDLVRSPDIKISHIFIIDQAGTWHDLGKAFTDFSVAVTDTAESTRRFGDAFAKAFTISFNAQGQGRFIRTLMRHPGPRYSTNRGESFDIPLGDRR